MRNSSPSKLTLWMEYSFAELDKQMNSIEYTFRLWRKNAGATLMAALAMAFGIGLVSTQFSFMNGVILRGLPFEDAERIVYLERLNPRTRLSAALPLGEFLRFREQQQSFESLGAMATGHKTLSRQERLPQRYRA